VHRSIKPEHPTFSSVNKVIHIANYFSLNYYMDAISVRDVWMDVPFLDVTAGQACPTHSNLIIIPA
jgi:hypothetical protein